MAVLIDTSFLLALAVTADSNHELAQNTLSKLRTPLVVPVPALPEMFYMVSVRVHYRAAVKIYNYIQGADFHIEPLTPEDQIRMGEIMVKYLDIELDFVDTATMAISERLNITRVCTFDRRDFAIFRPQHCPYLELLP